MEFFIKNVQSNVNGKNVNFFSYSHEIICVFWFSRKSNNRKRFRNDES